MRESPPPFPFPFLIYLTYIHAKVKLCRNKFFPEGTKTVCKYDYVFNALMSFVVAEENLLKVRQLPSTSIQGPLIVLSEPCIPDENS